MSLKLELMSKVPFFYLAWQPEVELESGVRGQECCSDLLRVEVQAPPVVKVRTLAEVGLEVRGQRIMLVNCC